MKVSDTDTIVSHHRFDRFAAYHTRYDCDFLRELLRKPDKVMESSPPGQLFKSDSTTTVARVLGDDLDLVIKRYNTRNRWHVFKRALRRTRAMRSWNMAHELLRIGVSTPPPAAVIEERWGPFRKRSYFINEFVPGEPCWSYLKSTPMASESLMTQLTTLFETLSRHRISHGDMKATNILVHEGRLVLVDLDAARRHVFRLTFSRASRRDYRRFLRNWRDNPALSAGFESLLKQDRALRKF
ncbi:MAG: lipopolysaccharide kinase InaA family protein [Gammaproteobacteria bacterium]|nr:lipopolysaccharide kinase InaA family protein [Gammaproteobacteria bacterium]